MKILFLHGPNLNLLGEREPEIYGHETLAEIDARIADRASELGVEVRSYQSNHEGVLIDHIHAQRKWAQAIVINPGAFTHYSYAIRDALASVNLPIIEVHLSDLTKREEFRRHSVLEGLPKLERIMGKGPAGYLEALNRLATSVL